LRAAWNLRGRRDTKIQVIEMSVSSLYYLFSVSSLISKIWLFARSGVNKFQFSKAYIWKITFHTMSFEEFLFEEMRRIDLLWKIVEYRASFL
jgi:hypothetical protein